MTRFNFVVSGASLLLATSPLLAQKAAPPQSDARLPMDSAVVVGKLPNGLRYYIRRNTNPTDRAELRLVVNAGSVLEDDNQRGLAHFVEHMAFNGTTHFKKNELIHYLESLGMRFGADLNATTNYDETIYELSIPTDSASLRTGLLILEDWAHGVQFDSANVVAERKVILEELRLHLGADMRAQLAHDTVRYRGSPYASRTPIGLRERIETANPSDLKRFYADWYRPDLITVVAVGDFDVKSMEARIAAEFGALKAPTHERPRPAITVPFQSSRALSVVRDREQKTWSAGLVYRKPKSSTTPGSAAAYRLSRIDGIFTSVINQRLAQAAQRPESPLVAASIVTGRFQRSGSAYEISVNAKPNKLDSAIAAALTEVERVARDGVSAPEFDRERKKLLRTADEAISAADFAPSAALANAYADNALHGNVSLSGQQVTDLLRSSVATITANDVQAVARTIASDTTPLIMVAVPVSTDTTSSSSVALLAAIDGVRSAKIPPFAERLVNAPLVPYPPKPATIVKQETIPNVGIVAWTLSNGVRVLLKPMHDGDKVYLSAVRPGGISLADTGSVNYASAVAASAVVGASGGGAFTNQEIRDRFAGTYAGVMTTIGDYSEGVSGQSGNHPSDMELLFQLTYLKFTAPRIDSVVVAKWKDEAQRQTIDPLAGMLNHFLRNDKSFGRPVAGALADSVDTQRALAFYRARFANADGFTFVITGDFAPDSIRPYVLQYLGGLPANGHVSNFRDLGVRPAAGPVRHMVLTNAVDPVAKAAIIYSDSFAVTRASATQVTVLGNILQMRLTYMLRQTMGGVYGVQVQSGTTLSPYPHFQVSMVYTADPSRLGELDKALSAELDSIATVGPTATELHDVKEALRRGIESASDQPDAWAAGILRYVVNGWPLSQLHEDDAIDSVTAEQVRDLARRALDQNHRIEVVTMPRKFVKITTTPAAPATAAH